MFWSRKKPDPPPKPTPPPPPMPPPRKSDSPSALFITGDSNLDRRSVEVLLGAIARISAARDLETKLIEIVDLSIEIANAERGLLILPDGANNLNVRVARSREGKSLDDNLRYSTSVVKRVLADGMASKATVNTESDAMDLGKSVYDLKLRAVMCVAFKTVIQDADGGEVQSRGALYIDSRAATRDYTQRDLALFDALSFHISIALENERLHAHSVEKVRLEQSLDLARAIQNGLMPPVPKDFTGFDVHGWYRPAERTSGDFFDFAKVRDKRLGVVVGDVSGHGIGPALITAAAQASLRSYLRMGSDPSSAMSMLNQELCERIESGMFLTLLLLVLSQDGQCDVLNAGHHGPLVWRAKTKTIETVAAHGPALGWMAETNYPVDATLKLESGDVLVAYTDGLIEAHSKTDRDRLFGEERVREVLGVFAEQGKEAHDIVRALAEAALSFSGEGHEDDITLVVVKKL